MAEVRNISRVLTVAESAGTPRLAVAPRRIANRLAGTTVKTRISNAGVIICKMDT